MDIRDILRVVTSRWWLVIPLFVVVFAASVMLTLNQTAMYRSATTYLVQPALAESSDLLGALGIVSRQSEIASTIAEIASSRRIHRTAADASGLSDEELDETSLRTRLVPGTNVLEISAFAPEPEIARDFAAAVGVATSSYVSELYGDVFELPLLDSAQLTRRPASPNVPLYLGLGAAVALVLAIGAAFVLELLGGSRVTGRREGLDPSGAASEEALVTRLGEEVARTRWTARPFSMGLIDLDGCNRFRGLSHSAQADALTRTAAILGEYVTTGGLVGRVGPRVFAVVLPERDSTDAVTLIQYLGQRARIPTLDKGSDGEPLRLEPAVAVVTYLNAGLDVEAILLAANEALSRARVEHDQRCGAEPVAAQAPRPRTASEPFWTFPSVSQAAASTNQQAS